MFDELFTREYHEDYYNCAHLVEEAWQIVTGTPLPAAYGLFTLPRKDRGTDPNFRHQFARLAAPEAPCIVFMGRPGSGQHVGLFWAGKVLHITNTGVAFQPLPAVTQGYTKIRFYNVKAG